MRTERLGQDSIPGRRDCMGKVIEALGDKHGTQWRSASGFFVIQVQNMCGKELAGNKLKR